MSAAGISLVAGLLMDAVMGGLAVAEAFDKFREGRPPDETPEEAAAEFVREMLAQVVAEDEADVALKEWREKHGE
jgi:hypothetical protein